MNDKKKNTLKNMILTGSVVTGTILGLSNLQANATETFRYSELGSGGELRSELLNSGSNDIRAIHMSCGEHSKTKDAKADKKEMKNKDQKEMRKDSKKMDTKEMKDEKGDKSMKKEGRKDAKDAPKESKSKDASCGGIQ